MLLKVIHIKLTFLLIFLLYACLSFGTNLWTVNDSLIAELNRTTNPKKRYALLKNLADVNVTLDKDRPREFNRQLYSEALKNNDKKTQIEALLELSNSASLDSLNLYLSFANKLEEDNTSSKGLITLLRIRIESYELHLYSEKKRVERIQQILDMYKNMYKEKIDIYERIYILNVLCLNIGYSMSRSERYVTSLEELYELTLTLPDENYYLKGAAILRLAIAYSFLEEHQKSIAANKKLLEYIDFLEDHYAKQGRVYRDYTTFYYTVYRRILSNHPALTENEVEYYYNEVKKISLQTEYLNQEFNDDNRLHLYYYIAVKQYDTALNYIEKEITNPSEQVPQHILLNYYIEVLRALDKKEELLEVQQQYIEALQERINSKNIEKQNELQLFSDIESLKDEKNKLQIRLSNRFLMFGSVIFILLILFIIFLLIFRIRDKKLTYSLKQEKQALFDTQKDLVIARDQALSSDRMKSIFIQNMSHEIRTPLNAIVGFSHVIASIEIENKDINLFSNVILKNSELLLKLVDDLLMLSDIETGKFKAYKKTCNINKICNLVVEHSKCLLEAPVKLLLSTTLPDNFTIETDAFKLEVLLKNLLSNAIKFTREGTILLTCSLNEQKKYVVFTVTNSGIKIPKEQSKIIFERFVKLDEFSQGNGLGLFICRLVADILGGKIYLDTTYEEVTQFVFELPVE